MSEYDLKKVDKADVKLDKYVTMLQVKYGYTRQQAKTEIDKRVAELGAELESTSRLRDLCVIWQAVAIRRL